MRSFPSLGLWCCLSTTLIGTLLMAGPPASSIPGVAVAQTAGAQTAGAQTAGAQTAGGGAPANAPPAVAEINGRLPPGYERPAPNPRQSRSVVMARNGMAATSQPLAVQAALRVLQAGGTPPTPRLPPVP